MKKWIACLLAVMLAVSGSVLASAESGTPEWEYSASDARLTKYNGPGGDVVVPSEIDGKPVVFVEGSLLYDHDDIISVTFSDGIEGFFNVLNTALNVERIVLPATLEVIGAGAMSCCPKLKEITFPASLRYIDSNMLSWIDSIETVTFLGKCPAIGNADSVLSGLPESAVVYVPDDQVDAYRTALIVVNPEQIQPSGRTAEPYQSPAVEFEFDPATGTITGCSTLRGWIEVPAEIDGVPVRALGVLSFRSCKNLHAILLPDGLEEIGKCAFGQLNNLSWTEIPSTVKTLGAEAFEYYRGYYLDLPDGLTESRINASMHPGCTPLPFLLPSVLSVTKHSADLPSGKCISPPELKASGMKPSQVPGRWITCILTECPCRRSAKTPLQKPAWRMWT